ncbi:hypothetical protein M0R45_000658 [Rubus argutus]|uniref:Uncharacterized protein n=1 Tax=Rubus argutus TaxID=59490 RepID=A0AAW1VNR3_RUBAR
MEEVDSANILGEPDINDEEEEVYYASVPASKLQPRAVVSKARWNNEMGALLLLGESDTGLSLEDIYVKMSGGKNRCCWEEFRAYRQLKSLGYIVGRHEEIRSVIGLFNEMQINKVRPVFNVYLPNSKFRKSSPGDPGFVLCFTRGYPPSKAELEALEGQCGSIPLKFCNVEQGRVSFFSFDKVELPVLP